jgi:molybdopterin molybdotransferase
VTAARLEAVDVMRRLDAVGARTGTEVIPLGAAHRRVAASPVVSRIDVPLVRNAAMDGWAVRAADVRGATDAAPVTLRVVGASPAGAPWGGTLGPGEAVRIATGGAVPDGADAVVRVEDSTADGAVVHLRHDRDLAGAANVRRAGEDLRRGAPVVAAGDRLDPVRLARLAAAGEALVRVHARPRVAIVASGDELVEVEAFDAVLASGGARQVASSGYALTPMLEAAGGTVVSAAVVPDRREAIEGALRAALAAGADLVLTTGGISVGERDWTREVITALGGAVEGWRVAIRPGGPFGFGVIDGVPWLGLPGNPVSTLVTFLLFGAPLVRRLGGDATPWPRPRRVRLLDPVRLAAPLTHFLRARVREGDDGVAEARLTGAQGSHLLASLLDADVLCVVPPDRAECAGGTLVWALPWDAAARGAAHPTLDAAG